MLIAGTLLLMFLLAAVSSGRNTTGRNMVGLWGTVVAVNGFISRAALLLLHTVLSNRPLSKIHRSTTKPIHQPRKFAIHQSAMAAGK